MMTIMIIMIIMMMFPKHVHGYVLNGFDEIDQWHAESNASLKIDLR